MQHSSGGHAGPATGCFVARKTLVADSRPGELSAAIARARAGDMGAIRYLYMRFADNVYGYARSIVRNEHDAEDVTQQVFARLILAIRSFEDREVPFSAWLLRVAHNMAIDHLRRQRAVPYEEPIVASEGREDERLSLSLRSALSELSEGQRQVVVLRHIAGLSPAEIASRLGKSEDAIHGLHHRGRRSLQHALRRLEAKPVTCAA